MERIATFWTRLISIQILHVSVENCFTLGARDLTDGCLISSGFRAFPPLGHNGYFAARRTNRCLTSNRRVCLKGVLAVITAAIDVHVKSAMHVW